MMGTLPHQGPPNVLEALPATNSTEGHSPSLHIQVGEGQPKVEDQDLQLERRKTPPRCPGGPHHDRRKRLRMGRCMGPLVHTGNMVSRGSNTSNQPVRTSCNSAVSVALWNCLKETSRTSTDRQRRGQSSCEQIGRHSILPPPRGIHSSVHMGGDPSSSHPGRTHVRERQQHSGLAEQRDSSPGGVDASHDTFALLSNCFRTLEVDLLATRQNSQLPL